MAPRGRPSAGKERLPGRSPGFSPQLLFDTPAGLFGRGHHLGSRRSLVLQDSLDGPVRGRRGRHCRSLRLLAQGRCWRGVLEEKGWALLRPPGGRGAQAGLKQPHPLSSRKPLPASPSRHNDRNATGDAARRAALCRRHRRPRPAEEAGLVPQRGSDADAQAELGPPSRDI